jgi:hypothetical protein
MLTAGLPRLARSGLLAAAFSLALMARAGAAGADDQSDDDADAPPKYPTTEFAEGAKSASVTVGDIVAGISEVRRADLDPNADVPVLQVSVAGQRVIEVPGVASGLDTPATEASIAEMDPGNKHAEVYFSSFSGGAHCCSKVIVAEETTPGKWVSVDVGDFDGDGNYLDDVDGDGLAEIVTVDNRFLYEFDCYACSASPLVIYTVRAGKAANVTAEPRFLPAHRDWLKRMEADVDPDEQWTSAGYLAGWVAAKARVGEGADALKQLKAHWDYQTDVGDEVCTTGGEPENCPKKNKVIMKFPERLEKFLKENGFPL